MTIIINAITEYRMWPVIILGILAVILLTVAAVVLFKWINRPGSTSMFRLYEDNNAEKKSLH